MIGKLILAGAAIFAVRKLVDAGERARAAGGAAPQLLPNLRPAAPVTEVSAEDAWNDARKSIRDAEVRADEAPANEAPATPAYAATPGSALGPAADADPAAIASKETERA